MPVYKPPMHGRDHVPTGSDPIPGGAGIYEIKVFEDVNVVVAGDGKFIFEIPQDLDQAVLSKCELWVTTVSSSGTPTVQLRKIPYGGGGDVDMLSTKLSVDVGEKNSKSAAVQPVINTANDDVIWGDHIAIDVDVAGTGAQGLGVVLYFTPVATMALAVAGAKGDTGGVTAWLGAWSGATTYTVNQAVSYNGTSYVAITTSLNVIPGVTAGWETYWQVLSEVQKTGAIEVVLDGSGRLLDVGPKAYIRVPYTCTITSCTLLADTVGSVVVDIWKDVFANYPPTNSDSITAASNPTLSFANKMEDTILSGWTTALTVDDVLAYNVDSVSLISRLTISLKIVRI